METNEIMNKEEIIEETTEEIVKAASRGGLGTAAAIGLAMIAGGLACEFVVKPAVVKIKLWRANRKAICPRGVVDGDFVEDFDDEKDSEE